MTINSVDYNVQIIGKDHDTYTSGGTAPLTFQLVELYGEKAQMDSSGYNSMGWSGSEMRTTTLSTILSAMPSEVQSAIKAVSAQRSKLGAVQNRLEYTINNLENYSENLTSAESGIRDTDMAEEMVSYSKNNILQQAAQSMLAQANQSNQGVLSLLQ